MPSFEKPRDEPLTQTEARRLTSGRQVMALITASLPLIVVVIDQPRQPMPKARLLGFLTYSMCLARFCDFAPGKRFQGSDRDRPLASMQMSARFTFSN